MAALLSVRTGYEAAVAAALGSAADAVAVHDVDAALGAIAHLKDDDLGRAGILLGGAHIDDTAWPGLPTGAAYAMDVVECPDHLRPALTRLLFKVAVVDDLAAARSLVADTPDLTAVTREGDLLGAHFAAGGSSSQPSLIEVQAAVDEATEQLTTAAHTLERLTFDASTLEREREEARRRVDVALAKLHESDATLAAVAEELGQYGSQARNARAEADRLDQAIAAAQEARDRDVEGLAELESRLSSAEDAPDEEPDTDAARAARRRVPRRAGGRDGGAARAAHDRGAGAGAARPGRLPAQGGPGRARRPGRGHRPARAAPARGAGRRGGRPRRGRRTRPARGVHRLGLRRAHPRRAEPHRSRAGAARGAGADARPRPRPRRAGQHRAPRRDGPHPAADADRAARGARARGARARRRRRWSPTTAPTSWCPFSGEVAEGEETPEPVPFDREEQTKRLRTAERALAQLGRINPLALEEFSALEERHKFLTEQLEDLKSTRRDLLDIVREVDERVEQVFTEAYADVSKAFDSTFTRLFPGGEGRLVLTDPDDMLNTGIEVEARPAGKKVKRLSLLSGGERSLVAVAFLVSLFKARPSPFYILDEVEAALDDTNLGRLLEIYEELRENSQLLVITHQKRTMEVGDALYGVTMRGDGVSAVISQRLREAEPA